MKETEAQITIIHKINDKVIHERNKTKQNPK